MRKTGRLIKRKAGGYMRTAKVCMVVAAGVAPGLPERYGASLATANNAVYVSIAPRGAVILIR